MKNKFGKLLFVAGTICLFHACDTDMEIKNPANLVDPSKSAEYYENLRNYKKSDHEVAFGWYGNWTGGSTSMENSLNGLPDSVDFVSLWGNWKELDEARLADLRKVQTLKGTRALICSLVLDIGDGITPPMSEEDEKNGVTWTEHRHKYWGWGESHESKLEATARYANAICDTIDKYGYDGFDIDAEPGYAHPFPTDYELWRNGDDIMDMFIETLSKRIGPKSGTDRMLVIDGEPYRVNPKFGDCFNYYILQAYGNDSNRDLNNKIGRTIQNFQNVFPVEEITKRIIVCENFENWASTGGVEFTLDNGTVVPSLTGFALWEPVLKGKKYRKGGVGTFHMEYEYNAGKPVTYPYLRQAIQIMNPSIK